MSNLSPPTYGSWHKGCMMYAPKGRGKAWMQPLVNDYGNFDWKNCAQKIQVSSINDPALATFCEPAEKDN